MAINYTTLLGLAQPVTGTETGTWGDIVNDSVTQLVEDSIAGTATASVGAGNWTLTTTGFGAANQARCAILIPTGNPGVSRNIIAPAKSKAYVVVNESNAEIVLKAAATTGVTIPAGSTALCAWNGSDFVIISISGSSGILDVAHGGTGAATLTGVLLGNGTSAFTTKTNPTGAFVGTTDTQTLTNKRIDPRAIAAGATSGVLTPNGDTTDVYNAFGLTGGITMLAPSGTPADGQSIILRFKDNGAARTISWTTSAGAYRAVGVILPTTTTAGKISYVGCIYNSTDVYWDVIAVTTEV